MAFRFQQFTLNHEHSTMKIGTDAVVLAALTGVQGVRTLLDIGCGCGVVAFCMAQKMRDLKKNACIYGVDTDADSIAESTDNAKHFTLLPETCFHFVHDRIQRVAQQTNLPAFDLIISNPPFFGHDLKPSQQNRLKSKHRDDQLPFDELTTCVCKLLSPEGRFAIILPPAEHEEFLNTANKQLFLHKAFPIRPTASKPVSRIVSEFTKKPMQTIIAPSLTIRNEQLHYTEAYQKIMSDYLLPSTFQKP